MQTTTTVLSQLKSVNITITLSLWELNEYIYQNSTDLYFDFWIVNNTMSAILQIGEFECW